MFSELPSSSYITSLCVNVRGRATYFCAYLFSAIEDLKYMRGYTVLLGPLL